MKSVKLFSIAIILTVSFVWAQVAIKTAQRINRNAMVTSEINEPDQMPRSISINRIGQGNTSPQTLVQTLSGVGINSTNVVFSGRNVAGATFSGGDECGLDFDSGIILSSGAASNIAGPNNSASKSSNNQQLGDTDLDALAGEETFDAAVLEFDIVPTYNKLSLDFVLASEEYPEMIDYADVMAIWVDGVNIALIPGTTTPVSIGTINHMLNSDLYVENIPDQNDYTAPYTAPYDLQADGFTHTIRALADVNPGEVHHVKIAIADIADNVYDSWLLLKESSLISAADLAVDYIVPEYPMLGANYNLEIRISNNGPVNASEVLLNFRLPFGCSLNDLPDGVVMDGDKGSKTWSSLAPETELSLVLSVHSDIDIDWGPAVAEVSCEILDANPSDNRSVAWDAPVANPGFYNVVEDITSSIPWQQGLLALNAFTGLDLPTIQITEAPVHGSLELQSRGAFEYTPNPDYFGFDSFRYRLIDGDFESEEALVAIQIENTYDPVTISLEPSYSIQEDGSLNLSIPEIISNPDNAELSFDVSFSEGSWSIDTSSILLTPDPNWFGACQFTLVVNDTVQNYQANSILNVSGVIDISANPSELDFGTLGLGMSESRRINIQNVGNHQINLLPPYLICNDPAFAVSGLSSTQIPPQASVYFDLIFTPTEPIDYAAIISVINDVWEESPLDISATGSTMSLPLIGVTPEDLSLNYASGEEYQSQIIIQNSGESSLSYIATLMNAPSWLSLNNAQNTVAGMDQTELTVSADLNLVPAGFYTAMIHISSNAVNNPELDIPVEITVTGIPQLTIPVAYLDFGDQYTGQIVELPFNIQNTGSEVLNLNISVSGTGFSLPQSVLHIPAFSSGALGIRLLGVNSGSCSGQLTILSNDPDLPVVSVPLSANLIKPATIELSETDLQIFGIGEHFAGTQIRITNSGEETLNWQLELEDAGDATFWLDVNPVSGTITALGTQDVNITCIPTNLSGGMHQVILRFVSNDIYRPNLPANLSYIKQNYLICNYDNNDNANSGAPDLDMNVNIPYNSPKAPIEFNIFNNITEAETAKLIISASDVDSYENCPVYLNDHLLGNLIPGGNDQNFTGFWVDPLWLSNTNLIRIEPDIYEQGDGITIHQGQLILDDMALDAGILFLQLSDDSFIAGENVSTIVAIETSLANQDVSVHLSLKDPTGNTLLTIVRGMLLTNGADNILTESIQLPNPMASGEYWIVCDVYDLQSTLLQDSEEVALEIRPNQARIGTDTDILDFGTIPAGIEGTAFITVYNTGNIPLQIVGMASTNPGISVDPQTATIDPGAEHVFTVTMLVDQICPFSGSLNILSSDPQQPVLEIALEAELIANLPFISVNSYFLDFGRVFIGDNKSLQLQVTNPGPQNLVISSIDLPFTDFTCDPATLNLAYQQSASINVTFNPQTEGNFNSLLQINSNAANSPALQINLYASSSYPPEIGISPSSLTIQAESGESGSTQLSIANNGGSILDWQFDENLGKSLRLRGYSNAISQYAKIPNRSEIQLVGGSFSLSTWFKINTNLGGSSSGGSLMGGKQYIISKSSTSKNGYFGVYCEGIASETTGKKLIVQARNSSSTHQIILDNSILLNTWQHLAVTYSENHLILMLNGEERGRINLVGYNGNTDPWYIGKYGSSGTTRYLLDGEIDEFVIYKVAKSQTFLQNKMYARYNPFELDLGGFWNWDASNGYDSSTYHTMAVISGSPSFPASSVSAIPAWVNISPTFSSNEASSGQNVLISCDATNMMAGSYESTLKLRSNDYTQTLVDIPLTFTVTGDASLSLSPTSLEFSEVIINTEQQLPITISNNGTADLELDNIQTTNPAFSADQDSYVIAPGESLALLVSFTPTALINYDAQLTMESNATLNPVITVALSGMGALPPVLTYTPVALDQELDFGQTALSTIQIGNTQGIALSYSASLVNTGRSNADGIYPGLNTQSRGMTWLGGKLYFITQSSNILKRYDPLTQSIDAQWSIHDNPYSISNDGNNFYIGSASGRVYRYSQNIELITSFQSPMVNYPATVVCANSALYLMDMNNPNKTIYKFTLNGVLSAQYSTQLSRSSQIIHVPEHSPVPFYALQSGLQRLVRFRLDGDTIAIADTIHLPMGTTYSIAHNGRDFYILQNDMDYMRRIDDGQEEFNWVSLLNRSGSVPAGSTSILNLKFSALNSFEGDYQAELRLLTNDPEQSQVIIPIHMQVTGQPTYGSAQEDLDFASSYLGYPKTLNLEIENNGSAELVISQITCTGDFFCDLAELRILPWQSASLPVVYDPESLGSDEGMLSFETNDPNHPLVQISLSGECLEAPNILVNPSEITANLLTDASQVLPIEVQNSGLTPLTYVVQIQSSGSRSETHPRLPGDPTGTVDFPYITNGAVVINNIIYAVRTATDDLVAYDLQNQEQVAVYLVHDSPYGIAWDGSSFVIGGEGGILYYYTPEDLSSTNLSTPHTLMPTNVRSLPAFIFSGDELIVAGAYTPSPTVFKRFSRGGMLKSVQYLNLPNISALTSIPIADGENIFAYQNIIQGEVPVGGKILGISFQESGISVSTTLEVESLTLTSTLCHDGNDFLIADFDGPLMRIDDGRWLGSVISSATVEANTLSEIPVKLDPSGIDGGTYSGVLNILSNDPDSAVISLPVHMTVTGYPGISILPMTAVFDSTLIGHSKTMEIVVKNPGSDILQVSSIEISSSDFSVETAGFSLAPRTSKTLVLGFNPASHGRIDGVLTFTSNAHETPIFTYNVTGYGKTPVPDLEITPVAYNFGGVYTNSFAIRNFVLKNTGTAPLIIHSIFSEETAFSSSALFPITVASGDTVKIPIRFAPTQTRAYQTQFILISNLAEDKHIMLNGEGLTPLPNLELSPDALNFETVIATVPKSLSLYLMNTGQLPLSVTSISSADPLLTILNTPTTIPPGANHQLELRYLSTTSGAFSGNLTIESNDPDNPQMLVQYSGTVIIGNPILQVHPASIAFPLTLVGNTSSKNLQITNSGNLPLSISRISFSHEAFSTTVNDLYILPQQSALLPVNYAPTQSGTSSGTMILRNNSLTQNFQVPLSGISEHPVFYAVDPALLDISSLQAETITTQITISNSSNGNLIWNAQSDSPWMTISPVSGEISSGNSTSITVEISTYDLLYDEYRGAISIVSNSHNTPNLQIPVYLLYAEYGYTTVDNENNSGTGTADGDMDVLIGRNSEIAPVEFNIFLQDEPIVNAQIRILAQSLTPESQHKVYINNYLAGYLSAPPTQMQISNLHVNPAWLYNDPQQANNIRIVHDATTPDPDGIMILWGGITCNKDFTNATITELSYTPQMPVPGSQLSLKQHVETDLSSQSVRVVSSLLDASGSQILDIHTRQMTLLAYQPVFSTVIWNLPSNLLPGSYLAQVEVYDADTNVLQDTAQLPVMILADEPMITTDVTTLNFGNIYPGFEYSKALVVSNLGAAPLQVNFISFSSNAFSCQIQEFSIASGASRELTVYVNLNQMGPANASLNLNSNDPNNPTTVINLSAFGIPAPQISLSQNQLEISMDQYSEAEQSLIVSNTGMGNLLVEDIYFQSLDWVNAEIDQNSLIPSASATINLSFNSTGLQDGLYLGEMLVKSNDPALPIATVALAITLNPRSLIAEFSADPLTGYAPLLVNFISESYTTDGSDIIAWEWDFENDGTPDSDIENPSFTYVGSGSFDVSLKVTNSENQSHTTIKEDYIFISNGAPEIAQVLSQIEMIEDEPLLSFDLTDYFSDPDSDPLSYSISPRPNLNFVVEGSLLNIHPAQDYYGSQQIVITASDPYTASVSQTLWLHVLAQNDPPEFVDLPPEIEFLRFTDYTLDFAPYIQDPDTPLELITISISGNTNFSWISTGSSVTFSSPGDWFGEEIVDISLNDNVGRSITTSQLSIRIMEGLVASFQISSTDVLAGVPVLFQNTSPGNITHFEWDFDNDSIIDSSEENPSHVYALGGLKSPRLRILHKVLEDIIHEDEYVLTDGILVRGTNIPGGNAVGSWVLEDAPYNIAGPIVIPPDSSLTIDPEVQVNIIDPEVTITVEGSFHANNVNFSPLATDRWRGFIIQENVENMEIQNSTIRDAQTPFMIHGAATIRDCVVSKDNLASYEDECGIRVAGSQSPIIQNVHIENYATGIQIDSEFSVAAPTISNVRISNNNNTLRNGGVGISLSGKVLPEFTDVVVEDYPIGISYTGDGNALAAPPTLANIRVKNSSNTLRTNTIGIQIRNLENVVVSPDSIIGFVTGLDIQNDNPERVSRPTISNIRIRNSSNTVRNESTGIKLNGNVQVRIGDIDIDDYQNGISVIGSNDNTYATPSTISNIRIRNSSNTVRNTGIGIYIRDLPRVTVSNDSIFGYNQGLVLHNSNPTYAAKPTISNIRIRNSSNTVRNTGTGILLSQGIEAKIEDCHVQDYAMGLHGIDSAITLSANRFLNNDIAMYLENSAPGTLVEYNEILREHYPLAQTSPAIKLRNTLGLDIYNNSFYNYPQVISATSSAVDFTNNLVWASNLLDDIFAADTSTINQSFNNTRTSQSYPGPGNLNLDPLFIDQNGLDFALHHDSPMIDAGDPSLPLDPDESIRDIGANTYLHMALFDSDRRFVSSDEIIQFTNQSIGHPADISVLGWDFGNDGIIDSNEENPAWIPPAIGRYDIRLIIQTGALVDSLILENHILVQDVILMPPANPRLAVENTDIIVSWDPVLMDVNGQAATPSFYLCYANKAPEGIFRYIGDTAGETSYIHQGATENNAMFYVVIGFMGTREQLRDFLNSRGNTVYIQPRTSPNANIKKNNQKNTIHNAP